MTRVTMKRCSRCGRVKPLDAFSPHPQYNRQSWCKDCCADSIREKRSEAGSPHARYAKAQKKAYNAALAELRERHRSEFDAILAERMAAEGLGISERR